ncbi:MAG TPA: redoxin domain-containing protein [Gemmataceae bacterium]|jgi:peroxiredoxin|nr:redoxin domain-containing protein [Gemmataceae bacterium]
MTSVVVAVCTAILAALPIPDFELSDAYGTRIRYSDHSQNAPVVIFFLGTECPLANLYAPRLVELAHRTPSRGVRFLAVAPMPQDTLGALAGFARTRGISFPILVDPDAGVAAACRVTRLSEVVLLDRDRLIRYHGRIDDQYEPGGKNRGKPNRHDLAEAIDEVLAHKPVSVPWTPASGCLIPQPRPVQPQSEITYHRDVAPILQVHCQVCHRKGEVAPFPLTTFDDARHWAPMIGEVVANGTMPPWHANPDHGRFRNERRLTTMQKQTIAKWVDAGCPEGDRSAATEVRTEGWGLANPDRIVRMSTPFRVPAEGVIDYQHVIVDPGAATDLWVSAAEIRPGNRRVLHHCNVFLQPPDADDATATYETEGTLGSHSLIQFTPGTGPIRLPDGMAKLIPAGWKLHFVLHYTPIGVPVDDQTELAMTLIEAKDVRKAVATKLVRDETLRIPPHAANHRVQNTWLADEDCLLLAMFPHMHVRGKSFRYVAEYPDGTHEILLDIPAYDFTWQHRYELVEPKRLPAGTLVRCIAMYDNSPGNPNNPDPTKEVRTGQQSWDEMFNGYFEIVLVDQQLQLGPSQRADHRPSMMALTAAVLFAALAWLKLRARRSAA